MIIPRERKIVRFYIQLSAAAAATFQVNPHPPLLVGLLREILHPFTFSSTNIEWSSIYRVSRQLLLLSSHFILSGTYNIKLGRKKALSYFLNA
jgi:hypothetical protein